MHYNLDKLSSEVSKLAVEPRERRWTSLSYCIIDAVWSIGSNYANHVVPVVRRVAKAFGDMSPVAPLAEFPIADPVRLSSLISRYADGAALITDTNRQRTSTRSGIPKADAVLAYARVCRDNGLETLEDAQHLTTEPERFASINSELAAIAGEGADGIRRGYLWMLVCDDEGVKPDRMILRWLTKNGFTGDASDARDAVRAVAHDLSRRDADRTYSPWEVDHAIWLAQRGSWSDRRTRRVVGSITEGPGMPPQHG